MTWVLPLLLLAACGGEEAVTFRNRNAADWSAALIDTEIQNESLDALREGGVDALPVLRALLQGKERLPALVAIDMIGTLGPRADAAVPELTKALDRRSLRGLAATALGRIGRAARPALDQLRELMRDKEANMAIAAAFACWRIAEDPAAIPALVRGLGSGSAGSRFMATSSLGRIRKPAVDPLIAALAHEDPIVRAAAANALGQIGPDARKARRALYETLKDESAIVRKSVEMALQLLR